MIVPRTSIAVTTVIHPGAARNPSRNITCASRISSPWHLYLRVPAVWHRARPWPSSLRAAETRSLQTVEIRVGATGGEQLVVRAALQIAPPSRTQITSARRTVGNRWR